MIILCLGQLLSKDMATEGVDFGVYVYVGACMTEVFVFPKHISTGP